MHAKLVVSMYLMFFQTLGRQKLPKSTNQQRSRFSTWLSLAWKTFYGEILNHSHSILP